MKTNIDEKTKIILQTKEIENLKEELTGKDLVNEDFIDDLKEKTFKFKVQNKPEVSNLL